MNIKNNIRKHQGIIQTGGNAGRLRKGYRYSGKKLKNGLPQIIKSKKRVKSKKIIKQVGGNLPIITRSDFTSEELIKESGGGDIYKIKLNDKWLVYKHLKGDIEGPLKNIQDNQAQYAQLVGHRNLAGPEHIVFDINADKLSGYTMKFLENYTSVADADAGGQAYNLHLVIYNIIQGMKAMQDAGLVACPEHGANIMLSPNKQLAVMIDLDGIWLCAAHLERETLEQLVNIFMNNDTASVEDKQKYFTLSPQNDIQTLKDDLTTFDQVLEIARMYSGLEGGKTKRRTRKQK
tara:strand:- start:923 stop:1795 length:873 start_codon:yes stop_codon:yes gene_type:complete